MDGTTCRRRSQVRLLLVALAVTWALVIPFPLWGQSPIPLMPNAVFEQIEEEVPGFGGAFVSRDPARGAVALHVWLTEPDEAAAERVRELLIQLLGPHFDQDTIVIHQGAYTASQLNEWFGLLSQSLPPAVAVGALGVREQINRVVVQLVDPARDEAAFRAAAGAAGIPQDAIVIEQGGPIVLPIRSPWWERWLRTVLLATPLLAVVASVILWRRRRRNIADVDPRVANS